MPTPRQTLFSLAFILNSALLTACSIAFCVKWTNYSSVCGESQDVITVICAMSALVYGVGTLATAIFFFLHLSKQCIQCNKILMIVLTLSAGGLIFSVLAGSGMLISLYFGFDPSCLADEKSKAEFVCLWLLALYAVVSNAIFLFAVTYLVSREDRRKTSVSSEIYIVSQSPIDPLSYKV